MDQEAIREALAHADRALELIDDIKHEIAAIKRQVATEHAYQAARNA